MFVLRRVRVWPFDLYKTFRTNSLIATTSLVKIRRIVYKTNRTLYCISIEESLHHLSVDVRIFRKLNLARGNVLGPWILQRGC